MEFKKLLLIGLVISNISCSLMDKKNGKSDSIDYDKDLVSQSESDKNSKAKDWTSSYIGVRGYFNRPPTFESANDQEKYQRCAPFIITALTKKSNSIVMTILQGNNTINIVGANRKYFRLNTKNRIYELDHYLVKELDIANKATRQVASLAGRACDGKIANQMTKSEFLFVSGSPEKINNLISGKEKIEEWVYLSDNNGKKTQVSYFFNRGKIYSWR